MKIGKMRRILAKYDDVVKKFATMGYEVREEEGYSNCPYYFIGVKLPPNNPERMTWLFTAETLEEFMNIATGYFMKMEKKQL